MSNPDGIGPHVLHSERGRIYREFGQIGGEKMPDYDGNADRDAFLAALARVFEEFRPVSEGYGVTDISRFGQLVGGDPQSQVAIRKVDIDNEGVATLAEFKVVGKLPGLVPEPGECITQVLNITFDPPEWECIYYLSA